MSMMFSIKDFQRVHYMLPSFYLKDVYNFAEEQFRLRLIDRLWNVTATQQIIDLVDMQTSINIKDIDYETH